VQRARRLDLRVRSGPSAECLTRRQSDCSQTRLATLTHARPAGGQGSALTRTCCRRVCATSRLLGPGMETRRCVKNRPRENVFPRVFYSLARIQSFVCRSPPVLHLCLLMCAQDLNSNQTGSQRVQPVAHLPNPAVLARLRVSKFVCLLLLRRAAAVPSVLLGVHARTGLAARSASTP